MSITSEINDLQGNIQFQKTLMMKLTSINHPQYDGDPEYDEN